MIMESTVEKMPGTITVYSNINRLLNCLKKKLPNIRFHEVTPGSNNAVNELRTASVLITDYDLLAPIMYDLPTLKWAQGTWAGADILMKHYNPNKQLPYIITRFSGDYFGSMMSEYVVTTIVNHERNMESVMKNRRSECWIKDSQFQLKINDHRGICDVTIGILGMGAIGKEIAKTLNTLKATVWGLARSMPDPSDRVPQVDRYFSLKNDGGSCTDMTEMLRNCDYIINVLPSTPETVGLLNGDILKHCQEKQTIFMNIGRGNVINENDLVNALEQKWISAAILDVFEIEPLPPSSKLWKLPQVMITPHIAGVTKAEYVADLFQENYDKFLDKKPMSYVLDFKKGY